MRVRPTFGVLLGILASATAPLDGTAQSIPSPYRFIETGKEAGVFVGNVSFAKGRFGFGPSGGIAAGGRWTADLAGPAGFEVAGGVISGRRDVINPARAEGSRKVGEANAVVGTGEVRLRLSITGDRTWHRLAPFVIVGGGLAIDMSGPDPVDLRIDELDRFDYKTSFLGTVGLGSTYFLSDHFVVRVDGVFSLSKIQTPSGFLNPSRGLEAVEESEWVRGLHLSVGSAIRF